MTDTALMPAGPITTTNREEAWPEYRTTFDDRADTSSPSSVRLRQLALQLPKSSGKQRDEIRKALVEGLSKPAATESAAERIGAVIEGFLASKQPGRLDDAIDVLAHAGQELEGFAFDRQVYDPSGSIEDGDTWYVIVQAIDKVVPRAKPHSLNDWALSTGRRPLMEAAILVLGNYSDPATRHRLQALATDHPSSFVRRLAAEVLSDC